MTIEEIRAEIDAIDDEIAKLFVRRMRASEKVVAVKRASGRAVLDSAREKEVLARTSAAVGPDLAEGAQTLFATLMALSREHQRKVPETGVEPVCPIPGCEF